jgi:DTW domain-containing protein YfiP
MRSETKFVILMHVHEDRKVRNGTGRFTALSFEDAELLVGQEFGSHPKIVELLSDPRYAPMLLYPGADAKNLSEGGLTRSDLGGKRLLIFVLDATWKIARTLYKLNPFLHGLPKLMFTPSSPSKFVIKRQPKSLCLSTIEAVHELMRSLDAAGLDRYERPRQLLSIFMAMQRFQIECMERNAKEGTGRRKAPSPRTLERIKARVASGELELPDEE